MIIFNAIGEIRFMCAGGKGGAQVDGGGWMYVGSRVCIVYLCFGYVCRNVCMMMLCVCTLVCLYACICPHMYVV